MSAWVGLGCRASSTGNPFQCCAPSVSIQQHLHSLIPLNSDTLVLGSISGLFLCESISRFNLLHICYTGSSSCDSRRPLHLTREHFPGIDFSGIETNEDVLYERVHSQVNSQGEYRMGESEEATEQRGLKFLKWLMARSARFHVHPLSLDLNIYLLTRFT